jgi:apolipoprotein N-acyltransferase
LYNAIMTGTVETRMEPDASRGRFAWRISGPQSPRIACVLAVAAVGAFHLAYCQEAWGGLIVVYLACMHSLAWVKTSRWAFYLGLSIGVGIAAPQLWFFQDVFGPAAIGLWLIFGLWIAFYLLLAHAVVTRWPRHGAWWIPVVWLGFEYFRGELYYLRFAWLTPGFALSHATWLPWTSCGVYGFSFLTLLACAAFRAAGTPVRALIVVLPFVAIVLVAMIAGGSRSKPGPFVVGIQLEGPSEQQVIGTLERALREHGEADLLVLSEYCFDGAIPERVIDWCRDHQRYLIAGGKDFFDGSEQYRNTVFVVAPSGEIVFRQGKSVPVQFMADGLPADTQDVWKSPWGKIGIAICYDLSYSRVIDRLIDAGVAALIVPTMDAEDWGAHEHWLHAKIAPVRARELGVPIFRLASSGISQLVMADGRVVATAPFPGQEERIAGKLPMGPPGKQPLDRFLAPPAVICVVGLIAYFQWSHARTQLRSRKVAALELKPTV